MKGGKKKMGKGIGRFPLQERTKTWGERIKGAGKLRQENVRRCNKTITADDRVQDNEN